MTEPKSIKVCSNCKQAKISLDFPKRGARCKECVNLYSQDYYAKNREKFSQERKVKYKTDKSKGIVRKAVKTENSVLAYKTFQKEKHTIGTQAFYRYKRNMLFMNAKKRGIPFNLSTKDVKVIFKGFPSACPYCHENIVNPTVDRKDNDQGYCLDNCILVCSDCNTFKSDKNKLRIKEIYFHLFGNVKPSEI